MKVLVPMVGNEDGGMEVLKLLGRVVAYTGGNWFGLNASVRCNFFLYTNFIW